MLSLAALIGRPNVGKSTLFNCLCGRNEALVASTPGLTRDRHYARVHCEGQEYMLVDTAGLVSAKEDELGRVLQRQTDLAIEEAQLLLFVVDARQGLCHEDQEIAARLRRSSHPSLLLINKIDGLDPDLAEAEFSALGLGRALLLSAAHRIGISQLRTAVAEHLPPTVEASADSDNAVRIAILGRPNAGKSTLVNRLLGEERMAVGEQPGITRDSIDIPWRWRGMDCVLTDTAGVRRRRSISEKSERDSVWMALRAMRRADVVILILDAVQGATEQDLRLLGLILEEGVAAVVAVNKADLVDRADSSLKMQLERHLRFADFVERVRISALQKTGFLALQRAVSRAAQATAKPLSTAYLNRLLQQALAAHPPPRVGQRQIRLRHAHPGGVRPLSIVLHGSRVSFTPPPYRRYLQNCFRRELNIKGVPLRLIFRNTVNPYVQSDRGTPGRRSRKMRGKKN